MERNIGEISKDAEISKEIYNSTIAVFACCFHDGFAIALERILSGDLELNEMIVTNHGSEPARGSGGPADSKS